jgi:hypothetical protein
MSNDVSTSRLAAAQERMREAKRRFTLACEGVLRGDSDAVTLARLALDQVEEARAALRRLTDTEESQV